MIITHLELTDFRSYHQASVDFEQGVNAILGANGSGKSTLLAAIGLALFNTRPPSVRNKDLVREGAKSAHILVEFRSSLDDCLYEVTRQISTSGAGAYRIYGSAPGRHVIAEGVSDVTQELSRHLGISADNLAKVFANTVGVYQGTVTAPFLMTAAERKQVFDPLLRVDEYTKAVNNLRSSVSTLRERAADLKERIAYIEGQRAPLEEHKANRSRFADEQTTLDARVIEQEAKLAGAYSALEAMDRKKAAITEARHIASLAEANALAAENDLQNSEASLTRAKQAEKERETALAGHERYLAAEERLAELQIESQKRETVQRELQEARRRYDLAEAQLEADKDQLASAQEAAQALVQIQPKVEEQAKIETGLAQLRVSVAELSGLEQQLESQRRNVKALAAHRDSTASGSAEREILGNKIELEQAQQREAQERVQSLATALGGVTARTAAVGKQLDELENLETAVCPVCERELSAAHRQQLLVKNRDLLRQLESEHTAAQMERDQAAQEIRARERTLSEMQTRHGELPTRIDLAKADREISEVEAEVSATNAEMVAKGDVRADKARLEQRLAELGDPASKAAGYEALAGGLDKLRAACTSGEVRLAEISHKREGIKSGMAAFSGLDAALSAAREARQANLADHNTFLANGVLADSVPVLQQEREQRKVVLAQRQDVLAKATREVQSAEAQYDAEEHARRRADRDQLSTEHDKSREALAAVRANLDTVTKEIARLEAMADEQRELSAQLAENERTSQFMSFTRDTLRKAGPRITARMVKGVESEAAQIYSDLMDEPEPQLRWDRTYQASIEVSGRQRAFHQLSGGERMCAALALRLALLRYTSSIDVAFFDEPTAHLDPQRRAALAEGITRVQGFSQLFVISHDDSFEQTAEAEIRVTKGPDGSEIEA